MSETQTNYGIRVEPDGPDDASLTIPRADGLRCTFYYGERTEMEDLGVHLRAYAKFVADHFMDGERAEVFVFAERTALLLGCLRNYVHAGHQADLDGALGLVPEVGELLEKVRGIVPRPG